MLLSFDNKDELIKFLANDTTDTSYILMQGFQRMKHWTAIPLKPITFLYGPNSAGKGSVIDCHILLQSLFSKRLSTEFDEKLSRWHRREADLPLTIGLSAPKWRNILNYFLDDRDTDYWLGMEERPDIVNDFYTEDLTKSDTSHQRITWLASWNSCVGILQDMEVFLNGQNLAKISEIEDDNTSFAINIAAITKFLYEMEVGYQPAFLKKFTKIPLESDNSLTEIAKINILHWERLYELPAIFSLSGALNDIHEAKGLLVMLFATPFWGLGGFSAHVGPLRKILNEEQLCFSFSTRNKPKGSELAVTRDNGDGTDCWKLLAESELATELSEYQHKFKTDSLCKPGLLEEVNRWLSLPQFLDTGYRIVSDVRLAVPAKSLKSHTVLSAIKFSDDEGLKALVSLSLQDDGGRSVKLQDVGAGFSQVIPVLINVLDKNFRTTKYFEQPELHLHPKLQAILCDLFIEGKNKSENEDTHSIIESHSEHMILRLLRRMRETSMADIQHRSFKVTPDEVSILYFEPDGDESFVHLLRVLPDGTFVDRWPAGFFDERFEEMFNE